MNIHSKFATGGADQLTEGEVCVALSFSLVHKMCWVGIGTDCSLFLASTYLVA